MNTNCRKVTFGVASVLTSIFLSGAMSVVVVHAQCIAPCLDPAVGAVEAFLGNAADLSGAGLSVEFANVSRPAGARFDIVITDVPRDLFTNTSGQLGDGLTDDVGALTGQNGTGLGEFAGCGAGLICPGDEVGVDGFSATFSTASGDVVFDRNNAQIVAQEDFAADGVTVTGARQDVTWLLFSIRSADVVPLSPSTVTVRQGATTLATFELINSSALDDAQGVIIASAIPGALGATALDSAVITGGICGNSLPDAGEQCDDGNNFDNDCCSASCLIECVDANPCTADSCVDGLCSNIQIGGACEDGDPCTSGDACVAGACISGPVVAAGACEDGDPCTNGDLCGVGGVCLPGTVVPACFGLAGCAVPCVDPLLGPLELFLGNGTELVGLPVTFANDSKPGLARFDIVIPDVSRILFTNLFGQMGDGLTDELGNATGNPGTGLGEFAGCGPATPPVGSGVSEICPGDEVGFGGCVATFHTDAGPIAFGTNNVQVVAQETLDLATGDVLGAAQDVVWVLWSIRAGDVVSLSPAIVTVECGPVRLATFQIEGNSAEDDAQGVTAAVIDKGCVDGTVAPGYPATPLCDDGDPCTDDICNTVAHACEHTLNIAPCDDGVACTDGDVCAAGLCAGAANDALCADDGSPCTTESCDSLTGCFAANNTAACNDGNACTTGDTCSAGVCVSGVPLLCGDNNACTEDSCDPASGCVNVANQVPCDDNNGCTDDNCDPVTGCVAVNNSAACDDGNPCTTADTCSGGVCFGGPPLNCDDDNGCTDDSCDPGSGCVADNNTVPCDDSNACTENDVCGGGACVPGSALDCDDGNGCTDHSCDTGSGCVADNNTVPCDDSNACTENDVCGEGACVPGSALDCDDGNGCTDNSCDAGSGCVADNNTAGCEDGDACTVADQCSAGGCVSGAARDCNDNNVCTEDSCETASGCVYADNTRGCDDADFCSTADTCQAGECLGGPASVCDDNNGCTNDSCDPGTGCSYSNNSLACDDGNACTTADTCSAGTCVGGAPLDCDDSNACTNDSCDLGSGCFRVNVLGACDDGNACTTGDSCSDGACVGGLPPVCFDDNLCTDDSCEPASGCSFSNNGVACDDGDACTAGDTCSGGECVGGAPRVCDDGDVCTDDSCDSTNGCGTSTNTASCSDGDAFTLGDQCSAGICVSGGFGCPAEPLFGCLEPTRSGKSTFKLKDDSSDSRDQLGWSWKSGAATTTSDFGDPSSTTKMRVCTWDSVGGAQSNVMDQELPVGGLCNTRACWKGNARGFVFKDKSGLLADGLSLVKLRAGSDGKASVKVKGLGSFLGMVSLPLSMEPGLTVQMINDEGACWSNSFSGASKNTNRQFKAKSFN